MKGKENTRVLFAHPGRSSYHDNTLWFPLPPTESGPKGVWMKPGERIELVTDPDHDSHDETTYNELP